MRRIDNLHIAGEATADLLLQGIVEAELLEAMNSAYRDACGGALGRFTGKPRDLNREDFHRLLFEVACFAVFLIMSRESAAFFGRDHAGNQVEPEEVRVYNTTLLNRLEMLFHEQGIDSLRETAVLAVSPDLQFGEGEPLNATKRVAAYVQSETTTNSVKLFAHYVAYALDPSQCVVMMPIWITFVKPIVDAIRLVLNTVSGEWKKHGGATS